MRKILIACVFLLVFIISCKLEDIPKYDYCGELNISLRTIRKIQSDSLNVYYFSLDSLKGSFKKITLAINENPIKEFDISSIKNNYNQREIKYIFPKDGEYNIQLIAIDSCSKEKIIKKKLTINSTIYVRPVTTYYNYPDRKEARILDLNFDENGVLLIAIKWTDKIGFIINPTSDNASTNLAQGQFIYNVNMPNIDGYNGTIGDLTKARYNSKLNSIYIQDIKKAFDLNGGFKIHPFLRKFTNGQLITINNNSFDFELSNDKIIVSMNYPFLVSSSNKFPDIKFIPYLERYPENYVLNSGDTLKSSLKNPPWIIKKLNSELMISYTYHENFHYFYKINESNRTISEIAKIKSGAGNLDGEEFSIGTIKDFCVTNESEIYILEDPNTFTKFQSGNSISTTILGFGSLSKSKYWIRKIDKNGVISKIIDDKTSQISGLIQGETVSFQNPNKIAYNPKNNSIYFTDGGSYKVIVIK